MARIGRRRRARNDDALRLWAESVQRGGRHSRFPHSHRQAACGARMVPHLAELRSHRLGDGPAWPRRVRSRPGQHHNQFELATGDPAFEHARRSAPRMVGQVCGQPLVSSIPIDTRPRDAVGVRAFARGGVRIGTVRAHDPTAVAAGPVAAEPRLDSRSRCPTFDDRPRPAPWACSRR
jgi:hypothetical protein